MELSVNLGYADSYLGEKIILMRIKQNEQETKYFIVRL